MVITSKQFQQSRLFLHSLEQCKTTNARTIFLEAAKLSNLRVLLASIRGILQAEISVTEDERTELKKNKAYFRTVTEETASMKGKSKSVLVTILTPIVDSLPILAKVLLRFCYSVFKASEDSLDGKKEAKEEAEASSSTATVDKSKAGTPSVAGKALVSFSGEESDSERGEEAHPPKASKQAKKTKKNKRPAVVAFKDIFSSDDDDDGSVAVDKSAVKAKKARSKASCHSGLKTEQRQKSAFQCPACAYSQEQQDNDDNEDSDS